MAAKEIFQTLFNRIEIRTAATPPVVIDLTAPSDPKTQALLREVQPAIIFSGPAGRFEIAPYGVPAGLSSTLLQAGAGVGGGVLLGAVGLGLLAYAMGKRSR